MSEVIEITVPTAVGVPEDTTQIVEVGYSQPGGTVGDKTFDQEFNSTTSVTVTHNLGKYPAITVTDTRDAECVADVVYVDLNTATVSFTTMNSGVIHCN